MGGVAGCCVPCSMRSRDDGDPVDDGNPGSPRWGNQILRCGGDKSIYTGTLNGEKVAVCIAKDRFGNSRLQNEINTFKKIGMHPYIINMYHHGKTQAGAYYPNLQQSAVSPTATIGCADCFGIMGGVAGCCVPYKRSRDDGDPGVPKWGNQILCCGGDKSIYKGTLNGEKVAVCVAKDGGGNSRLQNEINTFKKIGMHPYIINMYHDGTTKSGAYYLAMEIIEPIGFDLDRLKNQYQFAGQSVPVPLMGRIIGQLAGALKHLHGLSLVHRDLKTENVLVNGEYQAKLIDMGTASAFGTRDALCAQYMAPELYAGQEQGAEVDFWGVGLILHQVYQHRWQMLCVKQGRLQMTPGMPSTKHAMEPHVRQAMDGLLAFDTKQRWTLETLTECEWVKTPGENSNEWHRPSPNSVDCRETLQLFQSAHPLPTALAVNITARNHSHLINQPLGKLDLGKKLGVMVLLVRRVNGSFERVPGAETKIERGDWMYFG
eukprot:CAMPEP_0172927788 /NCGR_PEP_ID=MMETSP1075-20121228/217648_1 /TAXON_ID=2916 /ORGANISM="Ceratium fusus, Strain PA161109" /LENGTH=487 /DNA_ID=CAMNT_0013789063 /DNA_START=58 /DNA_END=1517 /DNA_ORIENTATION=-